MRTNPQSIESTSIVDQMTQGQQYGLMYTTAEVKSLNLK